MNEGPSQEQPPAPETAGALERAALMERLEAFLTRYHEDHSRLSPEVRLSGEDRAFFRHWLRRKQQEDGEALRERLWKEYELGLEQLRHWDTITWALNAFFVGLAVTLLGAGLPRHPGSSDRNPAALVAGLALLWFWFTFIYVRFRARAMRNTKYVLLLEELVGGAVERFSVAETWWADQTPRLVERVRLRLFLRICLALLTMAVVGYAYLL